MHFLLTVSFCQLIAFEKKEVRVIFEFFLKHWKKMFFPDWVFEPEHDSISSVFWF